MTRNSSPERKLDFFAALFTARTDIHALRWENTRTGRSGWLPAVHGGWRKGARHSEREYIPLTTEVLRAHLVGEKHVGLYPLLDGDLCGWLATDFDGPTTTNSTRPGPTLARFAVQPPPRQWSRANRAQPPLDLPAVIRRLTEMRPVEPYCPEISELSHKNADLLTP